MSLDVKKILNRAMETLTESTTEDVINRMHGIDDDEENKPSVGSEKVKKFAEDAVKRLNKDAQEIKDKAGEYYEKGKKAVSDTYESAKKAASDKMEDVEQARKLVFGDKKTNTPDSAQAARALNQQEKENAANNSAVEKAKSWSSEKIGNTNFTKGQATGAAAAALAAGAGALALRKMLKNRKKAKEAKKA